MIDGNLWTLLHHLSPKLWFCDTQMSAYDQHKNVCADAIHCYEVSTVHRGRMENQWKQVSYIRSIKFIGVGNSEIQVTSMMQPQ